MNLNAAHLHLILNHLPILGTSFGTLVLLIGLVRKNADIKKIGLFLFVVAALAAIPTYFTGHPAHEIIEDMPGVTRAFIHDHEEAAEWAFAMVGGLGALSLLGLLLSCRAQGAPSWIFLLSFVLSLGVNGAMVRTADLGGKIRHTENRSDFQPPPESQRAPHHHEE
ncbi:MAG: hypothetical protein U1F57_05655 [bacterium]